MHQQFTSGKEAIVSNVSTWPEGLARVPYWVFQQEDVYRLEQDRLFQGACWNYLCLEADVANPGDYRTGHIGDTPVIINRDADGKLNAFENRCAHRGSMLAFNESGQTKIFSCVYHGWGYNSRGDLVSVPFKDGVKGLGGMAPSFKMEAHGPRKLRVAVVHGLVFGSLSGDAPPIEKYIGEAVLARVARVLAGRRLVVLGRFTQILPNNWKLYAENTKDSYHASILHLFFTTFRLNRLTQKGGIIVSESGANHVSYSSVDDPSKSDTAYSDDKIRSDSKYSLADPSLFESFNEFKDDITLQILTVFPGFVLQQILNSVVVRQILPRGTDQTELHWTYLGFESDTPEQRRIRLKQSNLIGPAGFISMEDGFVGDLVQRGVAGASSQCAVLEMGGVTAESCEGRVTETAVRGFWKAYRAGTGL
jgi:anthranilate 1,2-dioxygenase large subunit